MRSETEKIDEGPELTIVSLSGEVPGPRRRRSDGQHGNGHLRTGRLFTRNGQGSCLIHIISAGGLLIETGLSIATGDEIRMEIRPGQRIAGQIAWTDDSFAGVRFAEWLDVLHLLGNESLEGFPSRDPVRPAPGQARRPAPRPALMRGSEPEIDRIA